MEKTLSLNVEGKTLAENFLEQNYEFRRNVLRGIVEFRALEGDEEWRPVTSQALNSIIFKAKHELDADADLKADIKLYVNSEEPPVYDPVAEWFDSLPTWDGQDRIMDFWQRIPGITAEEVYLLSIWHRSVVAHWLHMEKEHGNECVPIFIGDQGIGKSTFCVRFLPPHLRQYYLDHFNLANKFDKEMALSNSLLVCLDELDQYTARQMTQIKQALSKVSVNARKIFGQTIDVQERHASLISTTNNRHPLTDPTGSRRFICIEIPKNAFIDNATPIDYEQLYAQLLYELRVKEMRYWYNNEETMRIQQLNSPYEQVLDLDQMIDMFYEIPSEASPVKNLSSNDVRKHLLEQFPRLTSSSLSSTKIGLAMQRLGFPRKRTSQGMVYPVTLKSA